MRTHIKKINWKNFLFLAGYHVVLFVCLPLYLLKRVPSLGLLVTTFALIMACGISITAGYHRLYAHRTYRMNPVMQAIVMLFGTICVQNSVLKWSHDHRIHHRYTDQEQDPYNIQKGFWYAHMLWIIEKNDRPFDEKSVQDLMQNRLVMFQYKYYLPLMLSLNAAIVMVFGWLFNDFFGAFTFLFLVRLFLTHHATFFINSIAHTWGSQPYSTEHSAVNNWIIAFFTFGEGYHNYHHTFAGDYRNGVRWYQYDPAKLFIWLMSKLGLADGLNRINGYVAQKRLLVEDRRLLSDHLNEIGIRGREHMHQRMMTMYDQLNMKLAEFQKTAQQYRELKGEQAAAIATEMRRSRRAAMIAAKRRMKELDKTIHASFRSWGHLCNQVLGMKRGVV